MFGSNFDANFGLPDFGFQGADPQGGYFGANAPAETQALNLGGEQAPPRAVPGAPSGGAGKPPIAAPSPLASGPLALGGGQPPQQPAPDAAPPPPAAGIGSPFGKPAV